MDPKKCIGCGSILQNTDSESRGYAKSLENDYCQSCFRLKHYRDFKRVKATVDDGATLSFIESFKGTIFWVLDIMHLNQSLHSGLLRSLRNKEVVLIVNKRDLLPKDTSDNKLKQSIMRALKYEDVSLTEILFVSALKRNTLEPLLPYIEDGDCAVVGCVNAGKSSILNRLLGKEDLSVSPVASTTADVVRIETGAHDLYDTPGLSTETALLDKVGDEALVMLSPQKTIKPMVFQLYQKQTLILGNLGAITVDPVETLTIISYLPFEIKRVKPERRDANLLLNHEFMIENPDYTSRKWGNLEERMDLEIFDIGFISIHGGLKSLETHFDKTAEIITRKALI